MTTEDTRNDTLIEELVHNAEGERNAPEVIHKGDDDLPAPMVVSRVSGDDGLVPIYDTRTGEESVALKYMLRTLLEAKRADGSTRFTTAKPKMRLRLGTLRCMLHQDDPNRAYYDTLGFPVCRKHNLTSPYMVKKHMKSRHPTVWEALDDERKEKEWKLDREERQALIKGVKMAAKKK